jgi:hypothetical protein
MIKERCSGNSQSLGYGLPVHRTGSLRVVVSGSTVFARIHLNGSLGLVLGGSLVPGPDGGLSW